VSASSIPVSGADQRKIPYLPERIEQLAALASNLSWTWSRSARLVFSAVDPTLWRLTRHNPFTMLRRVDPMRLNECARDPEFLTLYDAAVAHALGDRSNEGTWYAGRFPDAATRPIAYFCAEFGLHHSVPIYSGGLGVLAGDHCKASSDLGVPLVGVGLFYRKGYFDQRLRLDGWQEDSDERIESENTPLTQMLGPDREPWLTTVKLFGRDVHVGAWRMMAGRVPIYLLDTDLESNHPDDRELASKLYAGGVDLRLRQEWILGVGGVRVLRALGIEPAAWHANEGHAAFMMVERLRELLAAGVPYDDAVQQVRAGGVFTTHTPVPAGHDMFAQEQVAHAGGPEWDEGGMSREMLLAVGRHPTDQRPLFHMTVAALQLSGKVNGVAKRHGEVSREIWRDLWPDRPVSQVPIGSVTNGVHLAGWMSPRIMELLDAKLGEGWAHRTHEPAFAEAVLSLDDRELWDVHMGLKSSLMTYVREDTRRRWSRVWKEAAHVVGAGTLLNPEVLTIGFARRFATYKRADLMFRDMGRLRELLVNTQRPVQLVFAGKAHPADGPGKEVLQAVYRFTRDPALEGRVAFIEDYDMHVGRRLTQGVDLWLNLPRVPLEASGTSGMKAALNGVPQLSTLDGWWPEAYDGRNGWAIPTASHPDPEAVDAADAAQLYALLEQQVVPRFYERDTQGIPRAWTTMMKHAMCTAAQSFTAERMVQQYAEEYYAPIAQGRSTPDEPPTAGPLARGAASRAASSGAHG
jgi:starch phosphorylase